MNELQTESTSLQCALCGQPVSEYSFSDEKDIFCCVGCQTVFKILSSKNELDDFWSHPLFKQAVKCGLISNPALLEEVQSRKPEYPEEELIKLHLEVQDLWCPSCSEIIRLLLLREKGVRNCVVDYSTDLASVEYSPRFISKEAILDLIQSLGYSPRLFDSADQRAVSFSLYLRFIVAAFFSLNIMMLSYPLYASYFTSGASTYGTLFAWLSFFASLPVLLYSGWPILKRFASSLSYGYAGMETLIVIGVTSAFGLSFYELLSGGNHVYFDSMSVIITFVLLGKIIESKAKFSAKETLFRLTKAVPKRGRKLFSDGVESFCLLKEIAKGDLLVAVTGEKIVLDGVVVEGEGTCDESVMTGEAIPVGKLQGDKVLSGTILTQGRIVYRVESTEEETALHHIIQVIEKDIGRKTRYGRAVDPIIRLFVPVILAISSGTAAGMLLTGSSPQEAVLRAVSILLISCPCAIGIAAPLAEAQTLGGMAKLGAIVRNRGCLSFLGKEDVFVFDKTGTITQGSFKVMDGLEHLTQVERRILKAIASRSTHPVSRSIALGMNEAPYPLDRCEEVTGKGLKALCGDSWYFLGSENYLSGLGVDLHCGTFSRDEPVTEVYFASDSALIARIRLGDKVRDEAASVVQSIKKAKTILLSGDSQKSVEAVARQCGFGEWRAGFSPLEKRDFVERLKGSGQIVCMMGDGINDAAALTGADVGISVVTATDLSIQVSDVMLTTDRLDVITRMRALAVKGRSVLKQNLFWAFFYNVIGVGFAAFGFLSPLVSAAAMVLSSLIVLFNAQRIRPG